MGEIEEAEECDETPESEPSRITGDGKKITQSSEEIANIRPVPGVIGAPSPSYRGLLKGLKDVKFSKGGEMELEDDDHYFSREEDEELGTRRVVGSDLLLFTNNNAKVKKEIM